MIGNQAANALLAKVRSKYGRAMTPPDYHALAALGSVGEVAAALRLHPRYHAALANVQEAALHRDNLERLLWKGFFEEVRDLCRFESSVGDPFFRCFLLEEELERVDRFLRCLAAGHTEDMPALLSARHTRYCYVDLQKLALAEDYGGLLDALLDGRLRRLLEEYAPADGAAPDLPLIESTLARYRFRVETEVVQKHYHGQEGKALLFLLALEGEMDDLCRILRSKAYFGCPPEQLRGQLIGCRARLTPARFEEMVAAPDAETAIEVLKRTPYRTMARGLTPRTVDDACKRELFAVCRRRIHTATSPALAVLCYLKLSRIEISNLTHCIEGVRYAMPPDAIGDLLIVERRRSDVGM